MWSGALVQFGSHKAELEQPFGPDPVDDVGEGDPCREWLVDAGVDQGVSAGDRTHPVLLNG